MPTPLPESRMSSSVFSAWTLAACSPRSTGMEPTASKKDFMALPLMPPVVKYSAFAKKATGRGMSAWTITLSRNERWFGATMNGPSLGTFSRPMTVGRHVVVTSPRVVQRIASNIAIGVHLVQGCGPRAFGEPVDRRVKRRGVVHDLDGTGRVQFAFGNGAVGHRARSRAGGLVGGGAPDAVEESGDAVVRQDSAGKPFRLLGRDGDGPPRGDEVLEEAADSRVQPALRYYCGCVVRPVDADGVFQLCGRNAGDFRQGMAQLGPNHGVHPGLVRNRQAKLDEGRGDTVGNTPGGIDKSAVEVEDHGHCCMRHRLSFSRVCGCQKFAYSFRNTSGDASADTSAGDA